MCVGVSMGRAGGVQTGLNGGCCQELIALGCSAGLCVCSNLTLSFTGSEVGRKGR